MKIRYLAVVTFSITLALTLGACSSSSDNATSGVATVDSVAGNAAAADTIAADAEFNAADVSFAQDMIPHHKQAVEMATIALDPARNAGAEVKDLATRIQGAQDPEIKLMTGWLGGWGQSVDSTAVMQGMEGMEGMEGMMTAEEMTGLEAANGPAFDKLWLTMMVRHHKGAVAMSKTAEADGKAAVAKELAGKIISAQEAEIAEMSKLLAG